ncbi:MAG: hypothetical protein JXQ87_00070 [Bacteroidia bacterium]
MFLGMNAYAEEKPGNKWREVFEKYWPNYQKWYLSEGYTARPGYLSCFEALSEHMPELVPTYELLCELAGGHDLPARFLSLYGPPPYLSGCSQLAWTKGRNALIRNYDYSAKLFDGIFMKTNWLKPVMAMCDCMWGVLDGINGDGLAVSLSFGGRKVYGSGFGIPILLRYVLETCSTAQEGAQALARIPVHMQYNVTLIDEKGNYATVFLAPDRPSEISFVSYATNHQHVVEWDDYAKMTRTIERSQYIEHCLLNPYESFFSMLNKFLKPPLYHNQFLKGFGTLYTAVYHPNEKQVELIWPYKKHIYSFNSFIESTFTINLSEGIRGKMTT